MLTFFILISWGLSLYGAIDYICNNSEFFGCANDKEWLVSTAYLIVPILNLVYFADRAGKYFKSKGN